MQYFNSHAHVERDPQTLQVWLLGKYFNSHAHVERDVKIGGLKNMRRISTHTLTWSVTCACFFKSSGRRISTHTLTWSVTMQYLCQAVRAIFQLTRSRGA